MIPYVRSLRPYTKGNVKTKSTEETYLSFITMNHNRMVSGIKEDGQDFHNSTIGGENIGLLVC